MALVTTNPVAELLPRLFCPATLLPPWRRPIGRIASSANHS